MVLTEKNARNKLGPPRKKIFPVRTLNAFGYLEGIPAFDEILSEKKDVFTAPHTADLQLHQHGICLILQQNLNRYYYPLFYHDLEKLVYYPKNTMVNLSSYEFSETPFEKHIMGPLGKAVSGFGKDQQELFRENAFLTIHFLPESGEQSIALMALERKRKASLRFLHKYLEKYTEFAG